MRPSKKDQQSYEDANRDINEAGNSRHPGLIMVRLGDHYRKRDSSETKGAWVQLCNTADYTEHDDGKKVIDQIVWRKVNLKGSDKDAQKGSDQTTTSRHGGTL